MSTVEKVECLSVEEYLACERDSDIRHEYIDGELYAMVGASRPHNLITGNLHAALHNHLRGSPCRVYSHDMKVRIEAANRFYYPDLMVCCSAVEAEPDEYYETKPVLVIEVLSPSTAPRDRWEKRITYQRLESLLEYVLVAQDTIHAEIYRRLPGGWEREACQVNDKMRLPSIGFELALTAIYEGVSGIGQNQ